MTVYLLKGNKIVFEKPIRKGSTSISSYVIELPPAGKFKKLTVSDQKRLANYFLEDLLK